MVEVQLSNFANALAWLAAGTRKHPDGRFAALLDESLTSREADRQDVVDALIEAGALEVAVSRRRLQRLLALKEWHWADVAARIEQTAGDLSLVEWAWSRLPWQDS
jgi:hypothetical protein